MTRPVVAIGEALIDLIAPKGSDLISSDTLTIREGGAPANVAVGLARLGVPVQMRTVLGNDSFGKRLQNKLAAEGVDCSHVRTVDQPTTLALAWADADGDGHFQLIRNADAMLSPDDMRFDEVEAIVFGSVAMCAQPSGEAVLTAIRHATDARIPLVFDVNIRPGLLPMDELRMMVMAGLTAATVVKLSLDDARHLWGCESFDDVVAQLDRFDPPVAVITDGSRGAMLRVCSERIQQPVFNVDAVEPTGAGDAFTAAFVSRMVARKWRGADADDLRFAMAAGALATTKPGAMDGLPIHAQIVEFLNANAE